MITFNNINIIYYIAAAILGIIESFVVNKFNVKVINKELKQDKNDTDKKITMSFLMFIVIIAANLGIVYQFGVSIKTLEYLIITPMLVSALIIDFKLQIIPNRLNLTMFQIGVLFVFAYTFIDLNVSIDRILGMLTGGGIFLIITFIGSLIAGKEAMGLGDVKLMGALGLFFGIKSILVITVSAFLLGAVISILILIIRSKKKTDYIAFGPFIVIAAFVSMFLSQELLFTTLITIFSLGLNLRSEGI